MRPLLHPGAPLLPRDLWSAWNFEPALLLALALAAAMYLFGMRNIWQRAGTGHGVTVRHLACFWSALLALVLALVSPLDALSDNLFYAHMAQHLILILVAAPLLVWSDFPLVLLWALPPQVANRISRGVHGFPAGMGAWRVLTGPAAAWILFAVALWGWHAPLLFESALHSDSIHALEHFCLLAAAVLFWWALFKRSRPAHVHHALAVALLFTAALQSGVLGALMTFTTQPWYPYYAPRVLAWGLTPLQDQQLAGLLMWLPGGAVFTLLAILFFAAWLRALEQRAADHRATWRSETLPRHVE